jgi:hypothetical protein
VYLERLGAGIGRSFCALRLSGRVGIASGGLYVNLVELVVLGAGDLGVGDCEAKKQKHPDAGPPAPADQVSVAAPIP